MSKGSARRPEKDQGSYERNYEKIQWGGYLWAPSRGQVFVDPDCPKTDQEILDEISRLAKEAK